jgi:hypothetical protein
MTSAGKNKQDTNGAYSWGAVPVDEHLATESRGIVVGNVYVIRVLPWQLLKRVQIRRGSDVPVRFPRQ